MPRLSNEKPEQRIIGKYPDEAAHFGPYGKVNNTVRQALLAKRAAIGVVR